MLSMLIAAWGSAQAPAAGPAIAPELQPLAFLVGSCFRAAFPNSTNTDTHCFTILPGGRQVRDTHSVAGAPEPYSGETIYRWDPQARTIRFDYYASDGGYSAGTAAPTATGLSFPDQAYVGGNGQRLALRNTMTREADGYSARSEMRQGEEWREMWTMRFARVGPAPAR